MATRWYDKKVLRQQDVWKGQLLLACANWLKNQMVENAHAITGLLRNSITYSIANRENSQFGTFGTGMPTANDRIQNATLVDSARIGSGLVYANRQNVLNGWANKAVDQFVRSRIVEKYAQEIFKW